jgi:hypothetical protein
MATQQRDDTDPLDTSVPPENSHEEVEEIAVPVYDWTSQPIMSIAEGLASLHHGEASKAGRRHHRHRGRDDHGNGDAASPRPRND